MPRHRYSNLSQTRRIVRNVTSFINNLVSRVRAHKTNLLESFKPLDASFSGCNNLLIYFDQTKNFPELLEFFNSSKVGRRKIPQLVNKMNIFMDRSERFPILKVKGKMERLSGGKISKTPVLLTKGSLFLKLLILEYHLQFNHAGTYYTLHKLRNHYFIIKAYSAVKSVISQCLHCRRMNARTIQSNTNAYRNFTLNPPQTLFAFCYLDYAGPFFTYYGGNKTKTYLVIFMCIWSRSINIEVVLSADIKNFLMAFSNHVYSYGLPQKIFSDAGSTFTAAFPYIQSILSDVEVQNYLADRKCQSCTFTVNAKGSLNRGIGGFVESAVKLVKGFVNGAIKNNI